MSAKVKGQQRPLKFRLWDTRRKKWIHGPHKDASMDGCHILGETMLLGEFAPVSVARLNDLRVLQYTGVDDKHGRNVYEGDIIDFTIFTTRSKSGRVLWDAKSCAFIVSIGVLDIILGDVKNIEVKGNVFE